MGQASLDEGWNEHGEGERPVSEEARAVAGNGGERAEYVDPTEQRFPPVEENVEFAVTQVNYTVAGRGSDERPIVHVFGRTTDEEPVHAKVYGFRPYFYAPAAAVTEDDLQRLDGITGYDEADADNEPFESIRGERVWKIYGRTPRDVGQVREEFDHFEADIQFPNRFLIDKDLTSGVRLPRRIEGDGGPLRVHHSEVEPADVQADPRVSVFDIEVDDRSGFPEDGEEPIICIAAHDSYRDEYSLWLFDPPAGTDPPSALGDYDPIRDGAAGGFDAEVRVFDTEERMLANFLDYLDETDPDVLSGWNFDDFDAPYLLDRLGELDPAADEDLDPDRLSRVDEVWRNNWQGPNVKGRVVFDLLYAYRRTQFTELESYRLDAVGERELGVGKERYAGDIGDLWEDDPGRLLAYNLRDVELCVELDREVDIVDFWDEVRTFVGCKLEDATTPGDAVDMYVLHKLHDQYVLPSKGGEGGEDYEGGAVFDPITGVRDMVAVLDLKSLYPMCMVTINASPETKVDPATYGGETYVAPNGTHFRKEPDGAIREMVDELLAEREEKKARRDDHEPGSPAYERFDHQQQAVKVIMNSLYGVLGWDRFRLYDREMGAAVTATGRDVIEYTDSVMLEIGKDHDKESAIDVAFDLEERINASYDEFAEEELGVDLAAGEEHRFEIEFEKLYRRFFQAGKKKRYAGHVVWKEGKDVDDIDITGFEYQRSDIAPITKEVQQHIIEMIVKEGDTGAVQDYVKNVVELFKDKEIGLDRIGIPGGIGQNLDDYDNVSAHIRGARYANVLFNANFGRGSKPKHVYLERVRPEFFEEVESHRPEIVDNPYYREFKRDSDVICYEYGDMLPETFLIDYDEMLEKTLEGPISRIVIALDISWEQLVEGDQQTGLSHYM